MNHPVRSRENEGGEGRERGRKSKRGTQIRVGCDLQQKRRKREGMDVDVWQNAGLFSAEY